MDKIKLKNLLTGLKRRTTKQTTNLTSLDQSSNQQWRTRLRSNWSKTTIDAAAAAGAETTTHRRRHERAGKDATSWSWKRCNSAMDNELEQPKHEEDSIVRTVRSRRRSSKAGRSDGEDEAEGISRHGWRWEWSSYAGRRKAAMDVELKLELDAGRRRWSRNSRVVAWAAHGRRLSSCDLGDGEAEGSGVGHRRGCSFMAIIGWLCRLVVWAKNEGGGGAMNVGEAEDAAGSSMVRVKGSHGCVLGVLRGWREEADELVF